MRLQHNVNTPDTLEDAVLPTLQAFNMTGGLSVVGEMASIQIPQVHRLSLFTSIVSNSANSVVITDANRNILYVNQKFEQISGFQLSEVLGKNPRVLKSNKTPSGVYREMHRTIEAGLIWTGIFVNVHRSGSEYIEEATITPVHDDLGELVYLVAEKKDITLQKAAEVTVKQLAQYDSLTELPNRAYFLERINKLISDGTNENLAFSVLFADLDSFKQINDTKGHLAGDDALKEVARRFERCLCADELLARIGGDEFVVVHKVTTERSSSELAEQLIRTLDTPALIGGQELFLEVSIGSATWPCDGQSLSEILAHADLAMYEAKASGQSYVCFDRSIGDSFQREFKLSGRLLPAIRNNQFYLVYQPKIDLYSTEIVGVEALMRWNEPEFGAISPAEFISIAEKHHMMNDVGKWLVSEVCRQLNQWKAEGVKVIGRMAINISVQQLDHPEFYNDIVSMIESEGLLPSMFELEVTESVFMSDPSRTMTTLRQLEEAGFSIAIDDFGTGHSSLSYLKRFNASTLKIDKSFIDHLTTDLSDQTIVNSMIELGHNFNMLVVAEGVETSEQLKKLRSFKCDVVQGYYYHKPMSEPVI